MVNVVRAETILLNKFKVTFTDRVYDEDYDRTTFIYTVAGTDQPPDLSHFDLEIPECEIPLEVVGYNPTEPVEFGVDPTTGIDGIKWDKPLKVWQTREYSITFAGNVPMGKVKAAVKGGVGYETGLISGPGCINPIEVIKSFSVDDDGDTWYDANLPIGEVIKPGTLITFRFEIINHGDSPLTDLTLTDDSFDLSACELPESIDAGESYVCTLDPIPAVEGLHLNTATATGIYLGELHTDTDVVYYFGGEELLKNGSFENDLDNKKLLDNWRGSHLSKDMRVRNSLSNDVAYVGEYAFLFKGGKNENSKLFQILKREEDFEELGAVDMLTLVGFVKGKVKGKEITIHATIYYENSALGQNGRSHLILRPFNGYYGDYLFMMSEEPFVLLGAVHKTKVEVRYTGQAGGKVYVDDLHLLRTSGP
jgi:hypothetical protein